MHRVMKNSALIVSLTAALISTSAFAVGSTLTVPASPTPGAPVPTLTTTATGQESSNLLEKFYANDSAIYHGAPLDNLGSNYTLDHTGKANTTHKSLLDGTLTTAYLLDTDVGIGPVLPFLLVPGPGQHFVSAMPAFSFSIAIRY